MAVTMSIILLWFILPMLNMSYELVKTTVDQDHPTNQILMQLGDGLFIILGFVAFVVAGYMLFAYATRNVPFDYR